jgi:hypothetical protein
MNEEQQKPLRLQLNHDSIYTAAAKADFTTKGNNVAVKLALLLVMPGYNAHAKNLGWSARLCST